ncbi:MAG: hypothetical protein DRN64_04525 [Thaumarchaeota archaeon]|nr:MAG: hypothetical protein DRN64_04525 [Nitrososphaerota archaeon]
MNLKRRLLPFLLSLGGVASDYVTTVIGLGLGFYETHPAYHPLKALLIFWGALTILTLLLPKGRLWTMSINGVALASYLGTINNTLVILGLFQGLNL